MLLGCSCSSHNRSFFFSKKLKFCQTFHCRCDCRSSQVDVQFTQTLRDVNAKRKVTHSLATRKLRNTLFFNFQNFDSWLRVQARTLTQPKNSVRYTTASHAKCKSLKNSVEWRWQTPSKSEINKLKKKKVRTLSILRDFANLFSWCIRQL